MPPKVLTDLRSFGFWHRLDSTQLEVALLALAMLKLQERQWSTLQFNSIFLMDHIKTLQVYPPSQVVAILSFRVVQVAWQRRILQPYNYNQSSSFRRDVSSLLVRALYTRDGAAVLALLFSAVYESSNIVASFYPIGSGWPITCITSHTSADQSISLGTRLRTHYYQYRVWGLRTCYLVKG